MLSGFGVVERSTVVPVEGVDVGRVCEKERDNFCLACRGCKVERGAIVVVAGVDVHTGLDKPLDFNRLTLRSELPMRKFERPSTTSNELMRMGEDNCCEARQLILGTANTRGICAVRCRARRPVG